MVLSLSIGARTHRQRRPGNRSSLSRLFFEGTTRQKRQRPGLGLVAPGQSRRLGNSYCNNYSKYNNNNDYNNDDHSFRLYSDLDNFFGKGGDMDRLVEDLAAKQKQKQKQQQTRQQTQTQTQTTITTTTATTTATTKSDKPHAWRDALDLAREEQRDEQHHKHQQPSSPSPVEVQTIRGRTVHVKHDDQLRLGGSGISGNKARKMWTLNELPAGEFPACLVSYGGPQSNSMLALAAIANSKNRELNETLEQEQERAAEQAPVSSKKSTLPTTTNDDDDDDDDDAVDSKPKNPPTTVEMLRDDDDYKDKDDDNYNDNGAATASSTYANNDDVDDDDDDSKPKPNNNTEQLPIRFVYYAKKLPRFLRKQPNGNLFRALSLGMELVELSHQEYKQLFEHREDDDDRDHARTSCPPKGLRDLAPGPDSLWVPQGGAFAPARVGAKRLAEEIHAYWLEETQNEHKPRSKRRPLTVCVPGGTCSTALLLHHGLKELRQKQASTEAAAAAAATREAAATMDIEVVVVPCVGDAAYARKQMRSLSVQIGASPNDVPTILQPEPDRATFSQQQQQQHRKPQKYFSFGKPDRTILETFQELRDDCNLVVDLIYGAPSFAIMWRHWGDKRGGQQQQQNSSSSTLSPDLAFDPNQPLAGREIMYVHSGGLEGINSQMLRYRHDGLVEIKDVQLPGRNNRSKHKHKNHKKK